MQNYTVNIKDVIVVNLPVGQFILPKQNIAATSKQNKILGQTMIDASIDNDNFEMLIKNRAGTQVTHITKGKHVYTIAQYLPGVDVKTYSMPLAKFDWTTRRELGI